MAKVRNVVAALFTLFASTAVAFAGEREIEKLHLVARAYLHVADMAALFQQSRCGRFFTKMTESPTQAMDRIAQNLSPEDVRELQAFLNSDAFAKAHEENRKFIDGWFRSFGGPEYDEQTTCETIASGLTKMYDYAKEKWEYEHKTYARMSKPAPAAAD